MKNCIAIKIFLGSLVPSIFSSVRQDGSWNINIDMMATSFYYCRGKSYDIGFTENSYVNCDDLCIAGVAVSWYYPGGQ